MKVLIDLKDGIVADILAKAEKEQMPFNAMISILVEERMKQIKSEQVEEVDVADVLKSSVIVIDKLIERVKMLDKGEIFTVKEMLIDYWDKIHSPVGFGRKAAKALLDTGLVEEVPSKIAARKYKRI